MFRKLKTQRGVIDPLTIGILGFLAVSFIIGSVAVVRNNFDTRSKATTTMCPPYGAGPASCYGKPTGYSCGTNSTCQLNSSGVCQCEYQPPPPSPTATAYCDRTKCPNDCSQPTIDGGICNTYCKSSCPNGCAELSPTGGTCRAYCSQSCASNQECIATATGGYCQTLSACFGNLGYRCSGTVSLYCANEGQSSPDRRECSPGVCVANSERCRTNSGCEGRVGYNCDGTTSVYCQTEQTLPNYRNCGNEGRACVASSDRCFSVANPYCKTECKNGCAELSITGGTCNSYCDKTCGTGQECRETTTGGVCEAIRYACRNNMGCIPLLPGQEVSWPTFENQPMCQANCPILPPLTCDRNICPIGCTSDDQNGDRLYDCIPVPPPPAEVRVGTLNNICYCSNANGNYECHDQSLCCNNNVYRTYNVDLCRNYVVAPTPSPTPTPTPSPGLRTGEHYGRASLNRNVCYREVLGQDNQLHRYEQQLDISQCCTEQVPNSTALCSQTTVVAPIEPAVEPAPIQPSTEDLVGISGTICYCLNQNGQNHPCDTQRLCCSEDKPWWNPNGICTNSETLPSNQFQLYFNNFVQFVRNWFTVQIRRITSNFDTTTNQRASVADTINGQPTVYFGNYTPTQINSNHEGSYVAPDMIIIHTDGNIEENPSVQSTVNAINDEQNGCQFVVGYNNYPGLGLPQTPVVVQTQQLTRQLINQNYCSTGRESAINIEIAGLPNQVDSNFVPLSVELAADLMEQYNLNFNQVYGHNEQSEFGKPDPGEQFMQEFRQQLLLELQRRGRTDLM